MRDSSIVIVHEARDIDLDIERCLRNLGYSGQIKTTSAGELYEKMTDNRPQLLLLDVDVDNPDGSIECAGKVRQKMQTPILLMVESSILEEFSRLTIDAPFDFIIKPFSRAEFLLRLELMQAEIDQRTTEAAILELSEKMGNIGSWHCAPDDSGMYWSDGVFRLTGLFPGEKQPNHQLLLSCVHPEDRSMVETIHSDFLHGAGGAVNTVFKIVTVDNQVRQVFEECRHITDAKGKRLHSVGVLADISEIAALEEQCKRARSESDEFAGIISHDLQEPLRSVTIFLKLLHDRYLENLDEKGRDFLSRAYSAGARLEKQIQQLLHLARITSRGAVFAEQDINTVFRKTLERLQPQIMACGAQISCSRLPEMCVDADQLSTVFYNLVDNGLKFNRSSKPSVAVECSRSGQFFHFIVKDNGIGFPQEYHERIFKPFQRLHSRKDYKGEGMGLTFAKKIVERHGGSIWVSSQADAGTIFHFTLPETQQERSSPL